MSEYIEELDAAEAEFREIERLREIAIVRRRQAIAAAVAAGYTQTGIAERLGVKRQSIADQIAAAEAPPTPVITWDGKVARDQDGKPIVRSLRPARGKTGTNRANKRAKAAAKATKTGQAAAS